MDEIKAQYERPRKGPFLQCTALWYTIGVPLPRIMHLPNHPIFKKL